MTARAGTPEASRLLVQRRSQRERGVAPTKPVETPFASDVCRKCHSDSHVTETRKVRNGLRRRRVCSNKACGMRWTTNEQRVSEDIDEMDAFDPGI